jgi:phosphate transport system protein
MVNMPRETLDNRIRHLFDEILVLDSMVENATLKAVEALKKRDLAASRNVYDDDQLINAKRFELENELIVTIATQQPIMAHDLRLLASIYEVIGELERMGDYAKGIAKITLLLGDQPLVKPLIDVPRMADLAISMLHRAVDAFVTGNTELARSIPREDDEVDALYNQVYRELITIMFSDPSTIDRANHLLWAAHNLERMADRVTNICERTIYINTGQLIEMDKTDDEIK